MKKRYSIGFFCFACCALLLLTAVYQIRYRKAYEEVERLVVVKHFCNTYG